MENAQESIKDRVKALKKILQEKEDSYVDKAAQSPLSKTEFRNSFKRIEGIENLLPTLSQDPVLQDAILKNLTKTLDTYEAEIMAIQPDTKLPE